MTEVQRMNEFFKHIPGMIRENTPFMDWLADHGFFSAPASTKYHGAREGGLYEHSKAVALSLQELTERNNLLWMRPESPLIVGWFHDLCKIDQYTEIVDCPGEIMMGTDAPVGYQSHYEFNEQTPIKGHGEKSIIYLAQFVPLTFEEIMCIRYHMGAFYSTEMNDYSKAVEQYQNVLWTHTADMIASKVVGV